jgi:hypothetical protein
MRFWFMNSWAWVCFVGLVLIIAAVGGFKPKEAMSKTAARIIGVVCGVAIIVFGIWMNARWLIR